MVFGLALMWVYPYQAHVPIMDEAVRKHTLLTTSSKNWAYAFVWFNKDAQHVPLPKEGHLSAMIEGAPNRNMCGHLCQLEVHQLLQSEGWVVYPEGLNGGLEPVVTSLPESLAHSVSMLGKPTFLVVDLSHVMSGDQVPEDSAANRTSTPTSPMHLAMEHPPKAESHISMTAEVRDSCHMQHWTPAARCQGVPPWRGQHPQPWGSTLS